MTEMDRQLVGLTKTTTTFELSGHHIDFTGAACFGPARFGFFDECPRDLTLAYESNISAFGRPSR